MRIIVEHKVSFGKFCDYCLCKLCQTGYDYELSDMTLEHTQCEDGSNICSTCLLIEPCYAKDTGGCEFCKQFPECAHKPKIKKPVIWTKAILTSK